MAAQVQINQVDASGQSLYASGFIVLSGNYPVGGDPLNFTGGGTLPATADPSFVGMIAAIESFALLNVDVWSMNRAAINGSSTSVNYCCVCTKTGTPALINPSTGAKLVCAALTSNTTEHSAAAYESQYLNDIVVFMAAFTKMI